MHAYTDDHLMLEVRAGKVSDLGLLFERYHVQLFNFLLRLTNSRELAEDLTQEVFFRVLKYRGSFDPKMPFRLWIYRIARNVANDHFAKKHPLLPEEAAPEPCHEVDMAGEMHRQTDLQRLRQALQYLAPEKREILIQSRFRGLKYAEIAQISGTTVAAVKVRVHRAIKELRDCFFRAAKEEAS